MISEGKGHQRGMVAPPRVLHLSCLVPPGPAPSEAAKQDDWTSSGQCSFRVDNQFLWASVLRSRSPCVSLIWLCRVLSCQSTPIPEQIKGMWAQGKGHGAVFSTIRNQSSGSAAEALHRSAV